VSYSVEGKKSFVSLTLSSMDAEFALETISEKGKQIEASFDVLYDFLINK
jgi:hypothetical protein